MKKRYILLFISLFLFTFKSSALTQTEYIANPNNEANFTVTTSGYGGTFQVYNGPKFTGYGEGVLIFSFATANSGDTSSIRQVNLFTGSSYFACEIGSNIHYSDSSSQNVIYTATCPVNFPSGVGLTYINFEKFNSSGTLVIRLGVFATFVSKDSTTVNVDTSSVVSAQQQSTADIVAQLARDSNAEQTVGQQTTSAVNTQGQAIVDQLARNSNAEQTVGQQTTSAVNNLNDTISDDTIDTTEGESFFTNFQDNDHGLSSIISAPLNFIRNLASANCSPISLTIPFVNTQFQFPCMSTIYSQNFGSLFTLYQTVTFGIVAYYICVKIYAIVKGFKNPEDDRLEVLEL